MLVNQFITQNASVNFKSNLLLLYPCIYRSIETESMSEESAKLIGMAKGILTSEIYKEAEFDHKMQKYLSSNIVEMLQGVLESKDRRI